jgi:hypothetical protein
MNMRKSGSPGVSARRGAAFAFCCSLGLAWLTAAALAAVPAFVTHPPRVADKKADDAEDEQTNYRPGRRHGTGRSEFNRSQNDGENDSPKQNPVIKQILVAAQPLHFVPFGNSPILHADDPLPFLFASYYTGL